MVRTILRDVTAATTGEYAILLGLIAVVVLSAAQMLGIVGGQGFGVAAKALSVPNAASANDIGR